MESKPERIFCAPPAEAAHLKGLEGIPAPLAYRMSNAMTLQRSVALAELRGGIIAVTNSGEALLPSANVPLFTRQLQREALYRGARGIWLELTPVSMEQLRALFAAVDAMTKQAGLELWVPEWAGTLAPSANVLISSALSGGTLRARISEAITLYGQERVTLALEPMAEDFSLPSFNGTGKPLDGQELQELIQRLHPTVFYSTELCAHYFTYCLHSVPHFVLFDNAGSLRKKEELAGSLGLRFVLLPWDGLALA